MGLYTNKGLYNKYKKNHKEREENDYYATPTEEVIRILNKTKFNFDNKIILEPCVGGGHMMEGILRYLNDNNMEPEQIIATDYKDRGYKDNQIDIIDYSVDFLSDDYNYEADIIVMNPPYSILEPFLIRALEIANEKVICLCRMQVTEGESRYKNIFKNNPPTDIYQYVNRIQYWKNGEKPAGSSAQGYCWLVWDFSEPRPAHPRYHWLTKED